MAETFYLKPVSDFLDGAHHFYIPSYQRGYRWDEKQVKDLVSDIEQFAKEGKRGEFYCLQPVVVKPKTCTDSNGNLLNGWEVIDGQQRLTTLRLILNVVKGDETFYASKILYDMFYQTRPELSFETIRPQDDIDSFYLHKARRVIQDWWNNARFRKSDVQSVLLDSYDAQDSCFQQVKFIWYVAPDEDKLSAIKVFNNLNKGKIRLTNADLIKALFVLDEKRNPAGNIMAMACEWNMMENALHDDKLWRFLTNTDYNPATRIDLVFDFCTDRPKQSDEDYAYRKFQQLYDNDTDGWWKERGITDFAHAWEEVRAAFYTFLSWYENKELYHYIGFLLHDGILHRDIYKRIAHLPKNKMLAEVKAMVKERLNLPEAELGKVDYQKNPALIRKILLLMNVETCNRMDGYRFRFDNFKNERWDIEHVSSQTDNPLQKSADKRQWLGYLEHITLEGEEWKQIQKEARELYAVLESGEDKGNKFNDIYRRVYQEVESEEMEDTKDLIYNLTLLDAHTNRSYGNALFPTKREEILKKDKDGKFIPPCTKNLFLKYYTMDGFSNAQWKNRWTESDGKAYLKAMTECLTDFLK